MMVDKDYIDFDFHIHSCFSFDSLQKPENIIKNAMHCGLHGIAVTDHNTIKGGLETKKIIADMKCDFHVIVGEEVRTNIGDVIGIFLNEEIKSRQFEDMVDEVRNQGGFLVLPHPFKSMHTIPKYVLKSMDALEGLNGRTSGALNKLVLSISNKYAIPQIAGSDAHFGIEIGRSRTRVSRDFQWMYEPKDLLKALRDPRSMLIGADSFGTFTYLGLIIKFLKIGHI